MLLNKIMSFKLNFASDHLCFDSSQKDFHKKGYSNTLDKKINFEVEYKGKIPFLLERSSFVSFILLILIHTQI